MVTEVTDIHILLAPKRVWMQACPVANDHTNDEEAQEQLHSAGNARCKRCQGHRPGAPDRRGTVRLAVQPVNCALTAAADELRAGGEEGGGGGGLEFGGGGLKAGGGGLVVEAPPLEGVEGGGRPAALSCPFAANKVVGAVCSNLRPGPAEAEACAEVGHTAAMR